MIKILHAIGCGGIFINTENVMEALEKLEELEKEVCNLPLIFSEIFKDEVNANDEQELYKEVVAFIRKYADNNEVISAVNEFTGAITGGASIEELFSITRDEALNPTFASALTVDETCKLDKKH